MMKTRRRKTISLFIVRLERSHLRPPRRPRRLHHGGLHRSPAAL